MRYVPFFLITLSAGTVLAQDVGNDVQATCIAGLVSAKAQTTDTGSLNPEYFRVAIAKVTQQSEVLRLKGELPSFPVVEKKGQTMQAYLSYCSPFGIPETEIGLVQKLLSNQLSTPYQSAVQCNVAIDASLEAWKQQMDARSSNAIAVGLYEKLKKQLGILNALHKQPPTTITSINEQTKLLHEEVRKDGFQPYSEKILQFKKACDDLNVPLSQAIEAVDSH